MSEEAEIKPDTLPDLDDLLQCPVCYEIPTGQIFQCNEGHHVCGRCKMRLELCPVCRALFFGTRNYAMEELIANVKKLRAFKLGGKVTCTEPKNNVEAKETTSDAPESESVDDDGSDLQSNQSSLRAPQACKGLFRCLSCKNGNSVRLPAGRLLNHLRYFHSPELIEGKSDNGEYLQAWQFSTVPGRIVTAVRVADMGIFFLIIEISNDSVYAWLSMAASPWVAHEFCYTVTISGNDREAIFSDCVWSVRSCEGTLKKRGHCLLVNGADARAMTAPTSISAKLSVRRTPADQLAQQTQPRAVLRVANRGNNNRDNSRHSATHDLEPFLQDLQNDVARLSRAFATFGREANALVRSEAEMRAMIERRENAADTNDRTSTSSDGDSPATIQNNQNNDNERAPMSRNARRRMRQRLRAALNAQPVVLGPVPPVTPPRPAVQPPRPAVQPPRPAMQPPRAAPVLPVAPPRPFMQAPRPAMQAPRPAMQPPRAAPVLPVAPPRPANDFNANHRGNDSSRNSPIARIGYIQVVPAPPVPPPVAPQPSSGPSNGLPQNGTTRGNKKKRRHRR